MTLEENTTKGAGKFILVGSTVQSATDGDLHFVSAKELLSLYRLNPNNCILVRDVNELDRYTRQYPHAVVLWPRHDGDYDIRKI